jgi:hypothetical protein
MYRSARYYLNVSASHHTTSSSTIVGIRPPLAHTRLTIKVASVNVNLIGPMPSTVSGDPLLTRAHVLRLANPPGVLKRALRDALFTATRRRSPAAENTAVIKPTCGCA